MNLYTLLFAFLNTIIILVYVYDSIKERKTRGLRPLVASLIVCVALIVLLNETFNETAAYFIINFALLFSILPFYYLRDVKKMFLFIVIVLVEFFYATNTYGFLLYPFLQMFAVGTAFGVIHRNGFEILKTSHSRSDKKLETQRDIVHMIFGVIILAVFLLLPFYYAVYVVATFILLGYIYNNSLGVRKKGKFYKFLTGLERPDALYGVGALYLGVGMMMLLGFIHNTHFVIIGISALLFADPLATIVGINTSGPKLFYNKKKSIYGTLAFFAAVAVIGYFFIGVYSLLFGAVLAVIESIRSPLDDNITIPVVMIVLYVIFLATLNQLPFFYF